ncbi:MAG: hypothetical protein K940chlam9_01131 [Chlamydiae bacterium]|nr:hypothetical protein [Chlamydiota bacterium]
MWKTKSQRSWIRLAFLLILFPFSLKAAPDTETLYNNMTVRESFYLREFFRIAISEEHFGYTLFFDKPMSTMGFFLRCPSKEMSNAYQNKLLKKGWKVWKKYETSFPHSRFLLFEEEESFFDKENKHTIKVCNLYLIHKKEFLSQIVANWDLFSDRLGSEFSPRTLLEQIESTKCLLVHLNYDETLLGILLGFGREAALIFDLHEKGESHTPLNRLVSTDSFVGKVEPVVFMGNENSLATQEILKKYDEQRKALEKILQQKDLLKLTLKALSQPTE